MTIMRHHDGDAYAWCGPELFLALLLACSALPFALTGCAGNGTSLSSPTELPTAQDDTPARKRARVRLELAASYFQAGKNRVALDEVKQVMQDDPSFSDAYNLAGLIYQALEQPDLAAQHFRRAIALNPRDGSPLHNLGWLQCQQKQYVQADQSFTQALAVPGYTDRAKTLMAQGICQNWAGKAAQAANTLKRSYDLDPGNPVTAYNLALLLFNQGRYDAARPYIRHLNNGNLANAQSLWLGVKIERALGNRAAMRQLGNQLQQRFGDSREASFYQRSAFDE
ncbi:MAG: type IV pilus biogenesis/stability protein PilW [Burkholderiaceae bacterium]|jgi:type IV pilus assembly protein PilF|nr:type IV pilus biogenesis/stability protein PilW [Burkholderiaceae bacterium]